jgi:hypothetical protein
MPISSWLEMLWQSAAGWKCCDSQQLAVNLMTISVWLEFLAVNILL